MKARAFLAAAIALTMAPLFFVSAASAQATRTWVSGVGDDVNPCSRTAPCKTFAGAISKTAAGGEISVLDPGGFGAVTITKAITITSDGGSGEGGILGSGTNGIIINAGVADVVKISGLFIHGGTPATPGLNGIRFIAGAALHVRNTVIVNFSSAAAGSGNGILFAPSGASELYVTDTYISESGANGILIQPTGAGSAKVSISNTNANNNTTGIRTDGTGNSGGINVSVQDSVVSGNTNAGISLFNPAGGPLTNAMVQRTAAVNNGVPGGLRVDGPNATLRVGNSIVAGNGTGTVILNGGVISSYGNNLIDGNTANGPNPPTIPPK